MHPGETLCTLPRPGCPLPYTRPQVIAILGPLVPKDHTEGREQREPNHTQGAVPSCVGPPRGQLGEEMRYKILAHQGDTVGAPHPSP